MPERWSAGAGSAVRPEVVALEAVVSRMAYLLTRTRRHGWVKAASRVPLDRAAVAVLRQLADSGAVRPGELADVLQVEAPHITRQIQLLERAGYATRVPDPDDGRAQLVELTASGSEAANRVRDVSRDAVQVALAHWSPDDLRLLGTLLHRMIDDFAVHAAEHDSDAGAEVQPP